MRPAQLRRFAAAALILPDRVERASMRPAQLRRFAPVPPDDAVIMLFGFNEAGAAAPVCHCAKEGIAL